MANGFDRRGAVVGVGLLILFVLIGWALLETFEHPVSIKITLPPVNTAPR